MNDNDINGWEPQDDPFTMRMVKVIALVVLAAALLMIIALALTAGCVTASKQLIHDIQETPTPEPTATPIPTEPTTEPTQYIEPKLPYDLWKYLSKQHNMSEWYTIERYNVSGEQDMILRTTVYRIRAMDNYYTWEWNWGGPTDGSADWVNIPKRGNKFVFVWVCQYIDGDNQTYDPQIWGMDENHVHLELDGRIYENKNKDVDLTAPIREFENTWDLSNTTRTGPYARSRIQDLHSGIITSESPAWLRMGRSNAWDGWVLFEVPNTADTSKAIVHMDFMALGKPAYWTAQPMQGY